LTSAQLKEKNIAAIGNGSLTLHMESLSIIMVPFNIDEICSVLQIMGDLKQDGTAIKSNTTLQHSIKHHPSELVVYKVKDSKIKKKTPIPAPSKPIKGTACIDVDYYNSVNTLRQIIYDSVNNTDKSELFIKKIKGSKSLSFEEIMKMTEELYGNSVYDVVTTMVYDTFQPHVESWKALAKSPPTGDHQSRITKGTSPPAK